MLYRDLEDFPTERIPPEWKTGIRGGRLHFWHLAWWPWYMRRELRSWLPVLNACRSITMLALMTVTATTGINLHPAVQALNAAFAPSGTSRDGHDCEVDRRAAVRGGNAQRR